MAEQVERHISEGKLKQLIKAKELMNRRNAEERGAWGAKFKKAVDEDHLRGYAFNVIDRISRMDPAKAAHEWRALLLYGDMMGIAAQTDLEDVIDASKESDDAAEPSDAAVDGEAVKAAIVNGGGAALTRLQTALNGLDEAHMIKTGLDRFITDHPELEAQANEIAEKRMAALATMPAAESGGGRKRRMAAAHH